MNPAAAESFPTATVAIPADLGIEHSRALYSQLSAHLESPALVLNGADVGRVHTATLQVLAAFVRSRAGAGRSTTWERPSAVLAEGAAGLGIESLLGLTPAPVA